MRSTSTRSIAALVGLVAALAASGGAVGTYALLEAQEKQAPPAAPAPNSEKAKQEALERAKAREALKRDLASEVAQLDAFSRAFRTVAKLVSPSVVHIRVTKEISSGEMSAGPFQDDLLRRFFGEAPFDGDGSGNGGNGGNGNGGGRRQRQFVQASEGSGVVYSADGLILTNNHVVAGADKIAVHTSDGRELEAKVVGTDAKADLAVIRVAAKDLIPVEMAKSSELEVGDWVIAIGNPFGLQHTVTAGIVSAVGRANVGIADYEDFIQTDAAINPGNSGGPLADIHGRVVGINTAIASRTGGFQGVGFAIPSDMVRAIAEQLVQHGRVRRGWLGISIQPLDPELARRFKVEDARGVLVGGLLPNGPAADAGLREGDVILSVSGERIDAPPVLRNHIAAYQPGTTVKLGLVRDGKPLELEVKLGELEDESLSALGGGGGGSGGGRPGRRPEGGGGSGADRETRSGEPLGLTVRALTPALAQKLAVPPSTHGVVIEAVDDASPAAAAGLRRGDVVEELNRRATPDLDSFDAAMKEANVSEGVLFHVRRGDLSSFMLLKAR